MTRKPKDVIGRVAQALLDCPLSADEIRALERIEHRRQEADSDMRVAITPEQRQRAYAKAARAGEEAISLAARVSARREANWSASALREFDALAQIRGDAVDETSAGARQRVSPLLRLHRAKLITDEEFGGGARYAQTFQRLYGKPKGQGGGASDLDPLDGRIADLNHLDKARGYSIPEGGTGRVLVASGLGGDARLISLVDKICGQELSLREAIGQDTRKRRRAFPMFKQALGLLALHYGLIKTREDELQAA
jgi:hypothetical protein